MGLLNGLVEGFRLEGRGNEQFQPTLDEQKYWAYVVNQDGESYKSSNNSVPPEEVISALEEDIGHELLDSRMNVQVYKPRLLKSFRQDNTTIRVYDDDQLIKLLGYDGTHSTVDIEKIANAAIHAYNNAGYEHLGIGSYVDSVNHREHVIKVKPNLHGTELDDTQPLQIDMILSPREANKYNDLGRSVLYENPHGKYTHTLLLAKTDAKAMLSKPEHQLNQLLRFAMERDMRPW